MANRSLVPNTSQQMTLKVLSQDSSAIQFKIRRTTPMKRIFKAYSDRFGHDVTTLRFRFDGLCITGEDTAASLELQNEDTIEVYQLQTGGGFY